MVIVAATLALSAGAALALQAGGVFGEASLLAERPHPASAVAVEPTECVLVPGWYLLRRLRRDGFLGERLLRDLLERRHRASAGRQRLSEARGLRSSSSLDARTAASPRAGPEFGWGEFAAKLAS